ncbi:MAG: dephospho-CoA kinase [Gammaproteobacteria bacterium]|nr:dephospho-CoA kinase [Gammaproteobacteria bacterium]
MLRVGLTGGIASGKSEAAAAFARLGTPVVDADAIAKELTAPGQPGLKQLVSALGKQILNPHGELDRGQLRQRLFADTALRKRVEGLLHPLIVARLTAALDHCKAAYVIAVIPLLMESAAARALVERVLVVDCRESLQVSRLMSRDHESESTAHAILAAQTSRAQRLAAGDDILINTGNLNELAAGVAGLHQLYTDIAGQPARPGPAERLSMNDTGC